MAGMTSFAKASRVIIYNAAPAPLLQLEILSFFTFFLICYTSCLVPISCRKRHHQHKSSTMEGSDDRYKPGVDFEEDTKDPLLDISLTDSTELWLIQWPINQLQPADFHGKELKLKLHHDGELGSLESSSGKSYDVISFAAQEPDATVFLPSASESKVAGKISRRVCLVRYPEPSEFEKPVFSSLNLSGRRSEGSMRKSMSRSGKLGSMSRETLTSAHSLGQKTAEFSQPSKKKSREDRTPNSEISMRSVERSSHASAPQSQITNTSLGSEQSMKKKKKKIKVEE